MIYSDRQSERMNVIFKNGLLVLVPQVEDELEAIAEWKPSMSGHVFRVSTDTGTGLTFQDLGPHSVACHEPINVTSQHADEGIRLIGNFAETPFELHYRTYRSVESFWQGLKFEDRAERERLATLSGPEARHLGERQGYGATIKYEGQEIVVGTWDHWQLMQQACSAKFTQHAEARKALLETFPRPLVHRVRHDSKTIPGAIMAEIWIKIRKQLQPASETTRRLDQEPGESAN